MENKDDNQIMDYHTLPQGAREWLSSLTVTNIIIELNQKHDIIGSTMIVIPRLITQLIVGMVSPENFAKKLHENLPFLAPAQINYIVGNIRNRILKPVAGTLRTPMGVDIAKIQNLPEETPQQQSQSKMESITPQKAQVSEFKRPESPKTPEAPKPKIPQGPEAKVSDSKKPFTLVEKEPE